MGIEDILRQLTRMEVSDIFLVAGRLQSQHFPAEGFSGGCDPGHCL